MQLTTKRLSTSPSCFSEPFLKDSESATKKGYGFKITASKLNRINTRTAANSCCRSGLAIGSSSSTPQHASKHCTLDFPGRAPQAPPPAHACPSSHEEHLEFLLPHGQQGTRHTGGRLSLVVPVGEAETIMMPRKNSRVARRTPSSSPSLPKRCVTSRM